MAIEITLLGQFGLACNGTRVQAPAWTRRQGAALVKLLALSPGRRLHREQVIDAIWPDQSVAEAAPRLHKAAHFARRAAGSPNTIVLRDDTVALFPDEDVTVDALEFIAAAEGALHSNDHVAHQAALRTWSGDLLPDDLYEEWTELPRERIRALRTDLLRRLGRWDELVEIDPTDEEAHIAVMKALAERGDRHGALRQFERLDRALTRELGVGPSAAAMALRDQLVDVPVGDITLAVRPADGLIGRDGECRNIADVLSEVDGRDGNVV